jgi:hypothetical protein
MTIPNPHHYDRMRSRSTAICLLALWTLAGHQPAALAQSSEMTRPPRAEVLVVGTYHMANPGRDIFNMQADDVLAPKRQAEIAQVVATLRKFQPTKVALERTVGDARIAKDYAAYLSGTHNLTRNEAEQLGFRLAKELGHKSVYAVDVAGEFPYQHLLNFAKATNRAKELDALMAEIGKMVKAQNEHLASHTILETLLYMNADDKVAQDVGFYYRQAQMGEPWDWAGADLLAEWFRRNIRIFSNIAQLVDSPNERVVVIYGAGHLGWLQYNVASSPNLRLRKLAEFAK